MAESINITLTPRQTWFKNRVKEVLSEMTKLAAIEHWDTYREFAKGLSDELSYAVTEWEKFYPNHCEHDPKSTCFLTDPPVYECKKCGERYFTCT